MPANDPSIRTKEICEKALAIASADERLGYLRGACGDDIALLARVQASLQAHHEAKGYVPETPEDAPTIVGITEKLGDKIGRYKLLQKIGEGGFGAVYMAEQKEPVKRRVALKIIKLGMDTRQVVARFEAERQAVALMDHPNIAKVFDAGATESGRPYFVMELVRGVPITQYCDENNLPPSERLQLFMQVCRAIQHAHQKGVIHRDIKPSNILVTLHDGVPVPKVIDFGIAKATQQELTEKTVFTQFQQFIGTPAYISPEQAEMSGLDIDTRSDIYSLGVLLYELLTGKTPFDGKELLLSGLDEMRRTIREKEPMRPSTRLSSMLREELTTTAKRRGGDAPKLIHLLRGDLDWIVMKALEKDRTRRYDTANGLVADLQRYLNSEPVEARPPSQLYRFQKLVRRNKLVFAATAAVAVALIAGLIASTILYLREAVARKQSVQAEVKAKTEAKKSDQVATFLKDMLKGVGPAVALGRDTKMLREILDKTAERIGKDLKDQPEVEAELRATLGSVYHELGLYKQMEEMFREALRLQKAIFGEEHVAVAKSLGQIGDAEMHLNQLAQADVDLRQALAMQKKLLGPEHSDVALSLNDLGNVLRFRSDLVGAESMHREALAMRRKLLGNEHPDVAESLNNLATVLSRRGDLAEAEPITREALAMRRKLLGNEHPEVAKSIYLLATILRDRGDLTGSEQMYREALALYRKLMGNEHEMVANSLQLLALVLWKRGDPTEAEARFREALSISRKLRGNEHHEVATSLSGLAISLWKRGDLVGAETIGREALAMRRKLMGNESAAVAMSLHYLGSIVCEHGDLAGAEAMHREALAVRRKLLGNEHALVAESLADLATDLRAGGEMAGAEALVLEAWKIAQSRPSFSPEIQREILDNFVCLYETWSKTNSSKSSIAAEWKQKLAAFDEAHPQLKPKQP